MTSQTCLIPFFTEDLIDVNQFYFTYFRENVIKESSVNQLPIEVQYSIFEYWKRDMKEIGHFYSLYLEYLHDYDFKGNHPTHFFVFEKMDIKKYRFTSDSSIYEELAIHLYHDMFDIYTKCLKTMKRDNFFYLCELESKEHFEVWNDSELFEYYSDQIFTNKCLNYQYYIDIDNDIFEYLESGEGLVMSDWSFYRKNVLEITLKNKMVRYCYTLSIEDFEKKMDELAEKVRLEYEEQMEISSNAVDDD